ncbi:DNA topoisomerase IB [Chitinimonas naiadis]
MAIPPAWREVWINADPLGHIQVTARDARQRKQYLYHPHWQAWRSARKYDRLIALGSALPKLRARVRKDLGQAGMVRNKVLAGIVQLLETTHIRIGNETYARDNRSYGLTTLRNRHVVIEGRTVALRFRGKSGQQHRIAVKDAAMARLLARCKTLPGSMMFQCRDEDGQIRNITAHAVNAYLQKACGADFSAKDLRTWHGTLLAFHALRQADAGLSARQQQKRAMEQVAAQLGNTPAVCRRSYVHPALLAAHEQGELSDAALTRRGTPPRRTGLSREEREMLLILACHAPAATVPTT